MALATLAQFKSHLGWKDSDTSKDAKLTLFLDAASEWLNSYCERRFESQEYTELFRGNNSNVLNPQHYPITVIDELRISSDREWSNAVTLVPATDYGISSDGLFVTYYATVFPRGFDNVRLIYTAGFTTIPSDLILACLWSAEWFYLHNNRGDMGRTTASKQGESIGILADMPPMIKSIIQRYKRMELPSVGIGASRI